LPKRSPHGTPGAIELVAIGISTGGPNALRTVLPKLPADLGVPILVVQHMPEGFTAEFARSLDRVCELEVKEAADGDLVKAGRVLIAPGNKHLSVEKRSLASVARVTTADPVNGHRPSADVLFKSVAEQVGNRALAVIMTGMGRDGARELGSIYAAGGITLGQDQATSVVYGMPKVAFDAGYVHRQVSLQDMASTIARLIGEQRS
jgi:two-component system chemotaxis response regulator CheB